MNLIDIAAPSNFTTRTFKIGLWSSLVLPLAFIAAMASYTIYEVESAGCNPWLDPNGPVQKCQ